MKVVINACYGGFGLSDEAVEYCLSKGMTCTRYTDEGHYESPNADFVKSDDSLFSKFGIYSPTRNYVDEMSENRLRCHPIVVEAVEVLGEKANKPCSKLNVIDIPFETEEGWKIDEYDGYERIAENHRTWE